MLEWRGRIRCPGSLQKRGMQTQTRRGRGGLHATKEVRIGGTCLHAKEHRGSPASRRSQEEARKDLPQVLRGSTALPPPIADPRLGTTREHTSAVSAAQPGALRDSSLRKHRHSPPQRVLFLAASRTFWFLCWCVYPSTAPSPLPQTTSPTPTAREPSLRGGTGIDGHVYTLKR